ncbi:MAG: hypothetical protein AABX70_07950 [Nanoarchaeota archaeon]
MPNTIPVPGPSRNLWTLDESLYVDEAVRFVAAQGIRGEGAIVKHDHGEENLVELVYLAEGAVYGGLEDSRIVKAGRSAAIPIGVTHGNLDLPSHGQWLSVKVHGSARYLRPISLSISDDCVAHMFDLGEKRLSISFADEYSLLSSLLEATKIGPRRRTAFNSFHLPLIDTGNVPSTYKSSEERPERARYLGIEWTVASPLYKSKITLHF